MDVESRLRWLSLPAQFTLQPYQQLAKVLKDAGDVEAPPLVLFEMEHRHRSAQDKSLLQRAASLILRGTIGYGQMPLWALWWLLGLVILGSVFYGLGYLGGIVTPTEKEAYAGFRTLGYPQDSCPEFNPVIYSMEHSFPLINLELKDHWQAGGNSAVRPVVHWKVLVQIQDKGLVLRSPALLRAWLWIQTIAGWVLATLFVAGLTGVVKSG